MFVKSLKLYHFRNFESQRIQLHPKINIFIGNNGQGKTNLLEAIYLNCTGRSFRIGKSDHFILNQFSEANLVTEIEKKHLKYNLKTHINQGKKNHFLNEKKVSAMGLSQNFSAILFSPESLSAIKDGPDKRRQLIDELIMTLKPENHRLINDYNKALRTRNRVLKAHSLENKDIKTSLRVLESLNVSFFILATRLTMQRIEGIKKMRVNLNDAMNYISRNSMPITVDYMISGQKALEWSEEQVYNALCKRQIELCSAELASGVSLIGPHKHDIIFNYGGQDSRFYCSQGQQRALILSFKMAQILFHREVQSDDPLLLLDDVLSELDRQKRESLIEFLREIESQIFITTTDVSFPESLSADSYAVVKVENGKVLSFH